MLVIRIFIINRITMSIQYDYKDDKAKADDDDATQKITNYNANEDDGNGKITMGKFNLLSKPWVI